MGFHDYFMADPPYMTGTVAILIIFEVVLVFFLIKRNPYLRFTKFESFFQKLKKKTPKPPPSKKVDITITANEAILDFAALQYNRISDKFSSKMYKIDNTSKTVASETNNQTLEGHLLA